MSHTGFHGEFENVSWTDLGTENRFELISGRAESDLGNEKFEIETSGIHEIDLTSSITIIVVLIATFRSPHRTDIRTDFWYNEPGAACFLAAEWRPNSSSFQLRTKRLRINSTSTTYIEEDQHWTILATIRLRTKGTDRSTTDDTASF